jgi:hypothetical protein
VSFDIGPSEAYDAYATPTTPPVPKTRPKQQLSRAALAAIRRKRAAEHEVWQRRNELRRRLEERREE